MEISANAAVSAAVMQQQANTQEQVQVGMLKKAIDTQTNNALSLITALPQPVATANSTPVGSLGQNINTYA